jgi:hypothetical protein
MVSSPGAIMPQASTIALADAQATPVTHNFVPNGKDANGTFWYTDRLLANAIGYWQVSVEFKEPPAPKAGQSSADRTYRIRIGLHEPVLENISNSTVSGIAPAPTVGYIPRCFTEYIMPERTVLLDRQNLRKMSANLQANAQIVTCIESLERIYA